MSLAPLSESDGSLLLQPAGYRRLNFNPAKYRHYLKKMDLTEEQKTQVLETLWSVMAYFVDLGFGVKSSLLAPPQRMESTPETDAAAGETPAL